MWLVQKCVYSCKILKRIKTTTPRKIKGGRRVMNGPVWNLSRNIFCILYLLIHTPNYERKLNVRSWVVNRMDILEEQRNIWPPGRPHQHFSEAQLPGGFLDLTPLPLQISLSIHYLHWQRAWCKSPETTYSSQQLDFSETVKWHFFPITLLRL